jgi:HD-like signal output (HDOD) protein/CheY-like chemotaxis protein
MNAARATMEITPLRALVVDDEPQLRALVGRALAQEQIACDFAEDGAAAGKKLGETRYDLVVTDLKMPNVNGHALCRSILARPGRPLLVAMTGVAEPRLHQDLMARGVDAVFEKPLDFATFGSRIRALLDQRLMRALAGEDIPLEKESSIRDSDAAASEPTATVAILMADRGRSTTLASELEGGELRVFVAEATDALCRFADENAIDALVIENVRHGFLSAAEVLSRLQQSPSATRTVVVGESPAFSHDQLQSLKIQKVFGRDVSLTELASAVRQMARNADRTREISLAARRIVRSVGLPPHSPAILLKLTGYLEIPPAKISIPDLARDVMADATTTAELLRLANGSSIGLKRHVTTVADCLSYLGPGRSVALLLMRSVHNMEQGLFRKLPPEVATWYQVRTILTASVSSVFADRYFGLPADTAFVLGLLQDIGIPILAQAFGNRYLKVVEQVRNLGPVRLHVVERQSFGVAHAEVSAALVEHLRLPEKFIGPIRLHHESSSIGRDVEDSSAFTRPMRIGEAFADFWDNRHPARREVVNRLLADCRSSHSADRDHVASLILAVRKTAEFAALFRLPVPDETAVLAVCKECLSEYSKGDAEPVEC